MQQNLPNFSRIPRREFLWRFGGGLGGVAMAHLLGRMICWLILDGDRGLTTALRDRSSTAASIIAPRSSASSSSS